MTSPEYQAPTWVNEDDPDFVEGVSPDLGAGYLNALSGAVEDHGQRLGAAESDVATLQATALDQADGDARYILQSNAAGFAPAEATANALAGKQPLDADLTALAGLDSATAGTVASDGGGWVKKTYAQMRTALGLATIATTGKLGDATDVTTTGAAVGRPVVFTGVSPATFGAGEGPGTVIAPIATGVASIDTTALQAAIDATPVGGKLYIPTGLYKVNAALSVTKHMTIEGAAIASTYAPETQGGETAFPVAPYLVGAVIQQTAAAANLLNLTGSATSVSLRRLGLQFASGLVSTGHGVNATPSLAGAGSGQDLGLTDFIWEEVYVHGHDGNHYAFVLLNTQYGTAINLRSYGGGGIHLISDLGAINSGNLVFVHPFCHVRNAGSADAIRHTAAITSGEPGMLNLLQYHRPQCVFSGGAKTQATQRPYNDLGGPGHPRYVSVYDLDFESLTATTQPVFGAYTVVVGAPLVDGGNGREVQGVRLGQGAAANTNYDRGQFVALGFEALKAQTSGQFNTAVGYAAATKVTSGTGVTAFGNQAAKFNTGNQNVAVGQDALLGVDGSSTGGLNVAIGYSVLKSLTTADSEVGIGQSALTALTTGGHNIGIGRDAGNFTNGSAANAVVTGSDNTFIGYQAGGHTGDPSSATTIGAQAVARSGSTAIGAGTKAGGVGSVALGRDSSGNPAQTTTDNEMALGTANHRAKILGRLNVAQRTPTSSADSQGATGDIATDDSYVYVKTSTGWKRSALTTF